MIKNVKKDITIIGLAGSSNVGKSTIASKLASSGYTQYSFASPLKKGVQEIFGLTHDQLYTQKGKETVDTVWGVTPREILQYVGTEFFRKNIGGLITNSDNNFWIKSFSKIYDENQKRGETIKYVIDDVRFINEAEFIKSKGGIVIQILRPEKTSETNELLNTPITTPKISEPNKLKRKLHISETELCNYKFFDGVIINDKSINDAINKLNIILDKRISEHKNINE